jgi:hypothetical protein
MSLLIQSSQLPRKLFYVDRLISATKEPFKTQQAKLFSILKKNRNTAFGIEHGFSKIRTIEDYQKNVPISNYNSLQKYIELMKNGQENILTSQKPIMFAITSGTTGKQKFIPVTKDFVNEYKTAWQNWIYYALKDHPNMLDKKIIVFVSPAVQGRLADGTPYGSISGLLEEIQPGIVKKRYGLSNDVFRIKDYDARYYVISRIMAEEEVSVITTPNPSLILLICKKMIQHRKDLIEDIEKGTLSKNYEVEPEIREKIEAALKPNPSRASFLRSLDSKNAFYPEKIWKDLVMIGCWKEGNMPLYLRQFPKYFGNIKIRDIGLMASEGRFSIPTDDIHGEGLVSLTSHFYEFIPEEEKESRHPQALTADKIELDKKYYIVLTASNGLYRYDLNDIIRVTGFVNKCPVIEFLHKGEHFSSITGEKLSEWQVVSAVKHASHKLDAPTDAFTACIHWASPPAYAFHMEFHEKISKSRKTELIREIDSQLKRLNREYEVKRDSMRLGPPILRHVKAGSYLTRHRHLVSMGAHDSQVKHPCLVSDVNFEKHIKQHLEIIDEVK